MIHPEDVIEAARKYDGTRFVHQGRSERGLDCLGLLIAVARDLGLGDYDYRQYARAGNGVELRRRLAAALEKSPRLVSGTILLLAWGRFPCHVGIYTGANLIHASPRKGVTENGYASPWPDRFRGAYLFPGVAYGS